MSRDCYWAANEGTSEANNMRSTKKLLQGDENLQLQSVFNNQLQNVSEHRSKRKTRISDVPTIQRKKKKVSHMGLSHFIIYLIYTKINIFTYFCSVSKQLQ